MAMANVKRIVAVLCGVLAPLTAMVSAHAATQSHRYGLPVVVIHGFGGGKACPGFDVTKEAAAGLIKVGGSEHRFDAIAYYACDTDGTVCDHANADTPLETIAAHIASCLHAKYGRHQIDVVGFSSGGDIARAMIAKDPTLDVANAVQVAAPNDGAQNLNCPAYYQCKEMKKGSKFLTWLHRHPVPQGKHGTDWSVIGSDCDYIVPVASALDNPGAHTLRFSMPCYGHRRYPNDVSGALNAQGRQDATRQTHLPHCVAAIIRALDSRSY
jgi:pimeloyl-ACP methyl ester carboxylesterase